MHCQQPNGLVRVDGLNDVESGVAKHLDRIHANERFVLDNEDPQGLYD